MDFLCARQTASLVDSLTSNSQYQLGPFTAGSSYPITASVVDAITATSTAQIWAALDVTTGTIKVAIGRGFALPIAGSFRLIITNDQTTGPLVVGKHYLIFDYQAGDDFSNVGAGANVSGEFFTATGTTPTTWTHASVLQDVSAELAYNASASDCQTALNAMPSIFAAGGVTVQAVDGFFTVTWVNAGPQPSIYGDASNLAPLSIIDAGTLIDGSVDPVLREVQTFQLLQSAGALATLSENNDPPSVTVDQVQVGGGGFNAQYRVTLDPPPNDGQFTLRVGGQETNFIAFNDDGTGLANSLAQLQATSGLLIIGTKYKIVTFATGDVFTNVGGTDVTGAVFVATGTTPTTWTNGSVLSVVGAGNVQVAIEATNRWLVMFIGDMADTDMGTMAGNASGLSVLSSKSGILDLDTSGISLILGENDSVSATLEVQYTPLGGAPQVVVRRSITLVSPIIKPASSTPTPTERFFTQAQTLAIIAETQTYASFTFSSAGTITITKAAAYERYLIRELHASAGTGAYTELIVLDVTGAVAGDIVELPSNFAASVNPTVEVHNATSGGTLLWSLTNGGSTNFATPAFKFDGTAWSLLRIA